MISFDSIQTAVWPLAVLAAWFLGEFIHRIVKAPRISVYALLGFALGPSQAGLLTLEPMGTTLLVANVAFGLILFECGYRLNLQWLRANPWLALTSLVEAALSFVAVFGLLLWLDYPIQTSLLLAALAMATSPATILRVINELKCTGQVTERVMHLAALNSVMAVFAFKVIVGFFVFESSGSLFEAAYSSLIVFAASVALGGVFGVVISSALHVTRRTVPDSTLAFGLAVIGLVVLSHTLKLSPVLASLTFGFAARHRRIVFSASQRGFGALGDILAIFLFMYVAATLEWVQVLSGLWMGAAILLVRQGAKVFAITALSYWSGITWRKGVLTGLAATPISAFVILVLEQTRFLGIDFVDKVAPLAAAALFLEVLGPVIVASALKYANEVPRTEET